MSVLPPQWRYGSSHNVRQLGRVDVAGGGQVTVQDGYVYVGHMKPPLGTSIIDVRDPKSPRIVAQIPSPPAGMSHKVRVRRDKILIANSQKLKGGGDDPDFIPGIRIFDASNPANPCQIGTWKCAGVGVHRFDIDDRYAYLGAQLEGFEGRVVVIVDLQDTEHPQEVGRWWLPGQWIAGGEKPAWERKHSCHHPLRHGDRLYVSYWHGGLMILDISDLSKPRLVSHLDWSPPYPCPTHTALRIPWRLADRDFMLCTDEEVGDRLARWPAAFVWMVDITDERNPIPVSTYRGPHDPDAPPDEGLGAHQPQEQLYPGDNIVAVTWFAGGLRLLDISDPYALREVGHYVPYPAPGYERLASNDVFVAPDKRIYVLDRFNGLEILEYTGER